MVDDNKRPNLIFGLGTGGCGSVSLTRLLDAQRGCVASCEIVPYLPWVIRQDIMLRKLLKLESRAASVSCDVAFYYLPYIAEICELRPNSRFICLQRERSDCIQSLAGKMDRISTNCYQTINQEGCRVHPGIADQLPKYDDEPTMVAAIGRYYDDYYKRARSMVCGNFHIFSITELNNESGVRRILKFAGFAEPNIVVGLKENVAP